MSTECHPQWITNQYHIGHRQKIQHDCSNMKIHLANARSDIFKCNNTIFTTKYSKVIDLIRPQMNPDGDEILHSSKNYLSPTCLWFHKSSFRKLLSISGQQPKLLNISLVIWPGFTLFFFLMPSIGTIFLYEEFFTRSGHHPEIPLETGCSDVRLWALPSWGQQYPCVWL